MEISDIVYLAFSTIVVIVILHVGVFWVSRLIQPPKPKIVYVDRTPTQPIVPEVVSAPILPTPPPPPPPRELPSQPSLQKATVPTYDMPPPIVQSNKPNPTTLPPPIETRDVDRVGFAGGKAAPPQ
uniref:Uncharacterized protein n=1 Tax=viral metagenome TaxID=1070528 RepID=A0A6C0AK10_9ZZZZ